MIIQTTTNDDLFVYSEIQFNEENKIASQNSKRFVCGRIFFGASSKIYTRLIKASELDAMTDIYPDTKIVYRTPSRSRVKFIAPKTELNI